MEALIMKTVFDDTRLENLYKEAAHSFIKTEAFEILQKKMNQWLGEPPELNEKQTKYVEELVDRILEFGKEQSTYMYLRGLSDCEAVLNYSKNTK